MFKLLAIMMMLLSGCATLPTLAPSSDRTKEYSKPTALKKDKAFEKTHEWVAKAFKDANRVIKLADKSAGTIVVKGNVDCEPLNEGKTHSMAEILTFTMTARMEDKSVKAIFSDIESMSVDGQWKTNKPSTKDEAERLFKTCIEPLKDSLFGTL